MMLNKSFWINVYFSKKKLMIKRRPQNKYFKIVLRKVLFKEKTEYFFLMIPFKITYYMQTFRNSCQMFDNLLYVKSYSTNKWNRVLNIGAVIKLWSLVCVSVCEGAFWLIYVLNVRTKVCWLTLTLRCMVVQDSPVLSLGRFIQLLILHTEGFHWLKCIC